MKTEIYWGFFFLGLDTKLGCIGKGWVKRIQYYQQSKAVHFHTTLVTCMTRLKCIYTS